MDNEYETLRESNIERNKKFLKDIGLDSNVHPPSTNMNSAKVQSSKKRKNHVQSDIIPSRRSPRIATLSTPSYKDEAMIVSRERRISLPTRHDDSEADTEYVYDGDESDRKSKWPVLLASKGGGAPPVVADPSKSSGCRMQLDSFYHQYKLGEPLAEFGKAHVMAVANGGTLPRFSKLSGVAPWADGFFLWVNISSEAVEGAGGYSNVFLDDGERMTWFGGGSMRPDSAVIRGLLLAGGEEGHKLGSSVVVFVRHPKQPYSCLGRVRLDSCDLTCRPVRLVWKLVDFPHLILSAAFRNTVQTAS